MITDEDIQKLNTIFSPQFKEVNEKIDELARITANGFSDVYKKFDEVDRRFNEVDQRFDKIETVVVNLDGKVNEIDIRLKKVESMLEPLFTGYKIMQKEFQDLNVRVSRIEEKTGII